MDTATPAATTPGSVAAASAGTSPWNIYFILKLLLFWRGLIDFHGLPNLILFALLALPLPRTRDLRQARVACAVIAATALLYHDSYLPPLGRVFANASAMTGFSGAYLLELIGRFVSAPVLALLAGTVLLLLVAGRFIRIGVVVLVILVTLTLAHLPVWFAAPTVVVDSAGQGADGGTQANAAGQASAPAAGRSNAALDRILNSFYASESRRLVKLPTPGAAELPFDLLFIHVCSLSWDDMEAAGLQLHPLWKSFDVVFRHFNSAASYSGPAAVRLNRATCGQQSNDGLYTPVAEQCYLMPSLKRAGFDINFAMNHDGHFDDFLQLVQQQGVNVPPLSLTGLPVTMKGFDDSSITDDAAVLARWRTQRASSQAPRTALYYNTISLHDGNRLTGLGGAGLNSAQSYKLRLTKLFDEMEALMQALASGPRRTVVVLIPEHGAALRGDRLQIAGLREIPTPAITTVPVGIRVIDPAASAEHDTEYVDSQTSFLALSEVIARMLEKSPFGQAGFDARPYVMGLPTTQYVAENQAVVMKVEGEYFWREDRENWRPFPADLVR